MPSAFNRVGVLLLAAGTIASAGCGSGPTQGRSTHAFSKKAVPEHLKGLRNERADVRREAAHALWQIGSEAPEATPVLLEVLRDQDPEVRAEVARALGHTTRDEKRAIPALVAATKDQEPKVRLRATVSLRELVELAKEQADIVLPALIAELKDPSDDVRIQASQLLCKFGKQAKAAVPNLIDNLKSENPEIRRRAAGTLSWIGEEAKPALPLLLKIAGDEQDLASCETAIAAIGTLGAGAQSAVPFLIAKVKGDVPLLKEWATVALYNIGPAAKEALPALEEALKTSQDGKYLQVVRLAIDSLNGNKRNS
ncbi:MAG TPA: HEAT repeat domain-containing protein [Gemmataceae bacterium]|nr:HEAT repeat domain-containing protein [Gemmataceae bacterium]